MLGAVIAKVVLTLCADGTFGACTISGCAAAEKECFSGTFATCYCVIQSCNDGNQCTTDSVAGGPGGYYCTHSPRTGVACSDGNPCTVGDACSSSGACVPGPIVVGTACSDGNACTVGDVCSSSGTCQPGPAMTTAQMDDGNPCTADSCDPATGAQHTPRPAGTSCSDGNVCNGAETCNAAGACQAGTPLPLDDGGPCTVDSCDPVSGVRHDLIAGCVPPSGTAGGLTSGGANPFDAPPPAAPSLGGPVVIEHTGELRYRYDFHLPPARGRYQPTLAITYSSTQNRNEGYGLGWSLSTSFVEVDTSPTPTAPSDVRRDRYWLRLGEKERLLVNVGGSKYRPEVADAYFEVISDAGGWTGVDGVGNTYRFDLFHRGAWGGGRYYLTSVTDVDGNKTVFTYVLEGGASALLTVISYNNYGSPEVYATQVGISYAAMNPPRVRVVASAATQGSLMLQTVRIQNRGTSAYRTLLRHEVGYARSPTAYALLLESITVYGGETATALLPTRFSYAAASPAYSLDGPTSMPSHVSTQPSTWMDLDGDGRLDAVWNGLSWARNTTPTGSSTVQFDPVTSIAGASGASIMASANGATTETIIDMNGDGIPDLVKVGGSCGNGYLDVRLGNLSSGTLAYAASTCFDARLPQALYQASFPSRDPSDPPFAVDLWWSTYFGGPTSHTVALMDVNGDGLPDIIITAGEYWHTFLNQGAAGWAFAQDVVYGNTSGYSALGLLVDLNGDGLTDLGPGVFTEGRSVSGAIPWSMTLSDLVTPAPWPWANPWWYEPDPAWFECPTRPDAYCEFLSFADPRATFTQLDLDGDGFPDIIEKATPGSASCTETPCEFITNWNTGGGVTRGGKVSMPGGYDLYPAVGRAPTTATCECTYTSSGLTFTATGYVHGFPYPPGGFVDLNGDGVADYVLNATTFFRGVATPALLQKVTVPSGAAFDIGYDAASLFGAALGEGPRHVVTSVTVSGPRLATNRTHYTYSGASEGLAWYEPLRRDPRGFTVTQSWDDVAQFVRTTTWVTGSHALAGSPLSVEWKYPTGQSATGYQRLRRIDYAYAFRGPVGSSAYSACTSGAQGAREPAATSYPLIPVTESVTTGHFLFDFASHMETKLESKRITLCTDVDDSGNVTRTRADPDTTILGNEYVETATFDSAAVCKNCPVETWTLDANGAVLGRAQYLYDSPPGTWSLPLAQGRAGNGHLNYVSRWAADAYGTARWEIASALAYNSDGTVYSRVLDPNVASHSKAVTEVYNYDAQRLRVTRRTVTDLSASLVNDVQYDPEYGWPILEQGPYLQGATGSLPTRAFAYDAFGRQIAVGRSASAGLVSGAISAVEYVDAAPPTVKSYTFAAPISFTAGSVPSTPDVKQAVSHLDGLGRVIQVRERLGGAGTADARAQIVQNLQGYRVAHAVKLDAVGRQVASLEPLFSLTSAYEDFDALAAVPGQRGSMNWFDERGWLSCSATGVYSALLASGGTCTSSFGETSSYRRATRFLYRGFVEATRSYVAAEARPPSTVDTAGVEAAYDAAGRLAWTSQPHVASGPENRTTFGYDTLGRNTSVTRHAAGTSGADQSARKDYDTLGRVVAEYDPNWSPGGTPSWIASYDASGRIWRIQMQLQVVGGSSVRGEIRHEYQSLGRRTLTTALTPVSGPNGISFTSTTVASATYDLPYANSAAYAFTAGRLASILNGSTTIAFGYDQNGAVARRDQWVSGFSGPFTVTGSIADDGRLLTSTFTSTLGSATTYTARYDSSLRPVRIDLGPSALWEAVSQSTSYGAYDPAGRLLQVRSNDGLVSTYRNYSPYSGLLASQSVQAGSTQIYGSDAILYLGTKVSSFTDASSQTSYGFEYDTSGRLSRAQATSIGNGLRVFDRGYGFTDPSWPAGATVGNLEQVATYAADGSKTTVDYDYAADQVMTTRQGATQLLAFSYDHGGRLSSKTSGGLETEGFSFDTLGRLVSVRRAGAMAEVLEYDPTGALLFRKVGTTATYYIGPFATVVATVPAGCTGTAECTAVGAQAGAHVLLGGMRIATVRTADVLYYHRDMRGSVVATTLSGGRVGVRYRYTEYGLIDRTDISDPTGESELGYTGGVKLTGSLLHLRARVYDADLKRFLQPDVVDVLRYTYVAGDPVNLMDPSGLEPVDPALITNGFSQPSLDAQSPQQQPTPPLPPGCTVGPDGIPICQLEEQTVRTGNMTPTLADRQAAGLSAEIDAANSLEAMYSRSRARATWSALYLGHLKTEYRSHITALAWTLRYIGRAAGEAMSGPTFSWGAGEITTAREWKFVLTDLEGLSADNPFTTAVAKDAIERTARSGVTVGARALGGMFLQTFIQAAVDATYTATASDIYTVLSRGRGP